MNTPSTEYRDPAPYRSLVHPAGARHVEVIDQRALPHGLKTVRIEDANTAAIAIRDMWVRGAPLIGAVGAYGLALALTEDPSDAVSYTHLTRSPAPTRHSTRPGRPPLTCAGRWIVCMPRLQDSRPTNVPMRPGSKPMRSPPRTSRSAMQSAGTASNYCAR